jgi:sigma-B regulation protein RsbU (phosphoserine phosphatase)
VVADVVDELGQAFPGRGLVHLPSGEGECVADADRVSQVVGNLVSNAMTYGEAGSAVTVRSEIAPREFRVSVHNAGVPIPPQLQEALFEPMVRGAVETGTQRSVGLGLFIVREIAKAHGGGVRVESTAAAGTTFVVTFPRPG